MGFAIRKICFVLPEI